MNPFTYSRNNRHLSMCIFSTHILRVLNVLAVLEAKHKQKCSFFHSIGGEIAKYTFVLDVHRFLAGFFLEAGRQN
eukprot:COSAG01_NODE_9459_length_2440_cov_14.780956_2_plen_75_part_00